MVKRQRVATNTILPLFCISHPLSLNHSKLSIRSISTISSSTSTPIQCKLSLPSKSSLCNRILGTTLGALILLTNFSYPTYALSDAQKLVAEAWRIVDQSYVDRTFNHHDWFSVRMKAVKKAYSSIDDGYEAIRDMLSLLSDPYTRFLNPQQYTSLTSTATGELAGVGVEMFPTRVDQYLKITSPIDDSPAARAGIRPSDRIILIDGESTQNLTPDEAAARIRGKPGTAVELTVVHDDGKGKEESFYMIRESLRLKSIKTNLLQDGILYIKIKQFNSNTAQDMKNIMESIDKKQIQKIVLDLRNNPGGYFPGGVDVARLFMKAQKTIVFVVDKNGIQDEIDTITDGMLTEQPMVVLVNKGTASASEILAGALKDNQRAKLVGEQTFGKGVVQTVVELSDGSGLAVTIARYETPAHMNINKIGIKPDVKNLCTVEQVMECLSPEIWS